MRSAPSVPTAGRVRLLALWAVLLLLVVGTCEGMSAAFYHLVVLKQIRYDVWDPDSAVVDKAWRQSVLPADNELGWPPPREARSAPYDATGAKLNPDFPDTRRACASAYGDSFVWGDDVPLADGWVEQLSRILGCRVSNFGVSGYGTDQAFIRFRRNVEDTAPVVLLGIYAQDVMRNVNQYRAFIGFSISPYGLKGRFVLDKAGSLRWIARPRLDLKGFIDLHRDPAAIVPQDDLLPGSTDGPVVKGFSYTWTLFEIELARMSGRPLPISAFLQPGHPSGAFELTLALIKAFSNLARQRHKRLLVLMLPDSVGLRHKRRLGAFEYGALRDRISASGIPVFDLGPKLLAARSGRSYCDLFARQRSCDGHYSVTGDRLVAKFMAFELKRRGLISGLASR